MDPVTIAAAVGALGSLFGKKKKQQTVGMNQGQYNQIYNELMNQIIGLNGQIDNPMTSGQQLAWLADYRDNADDYRNSAMNDLTSSLASRGLDDSSVQAAAQTQLASDYADQMSSAEHQLVMEKMARQDALRQQIAQYAGALLGSPVGQSYYEPSSFDPAAMGQMLGTLAGSSSSNGVKKAGIDRAITNSFSPAGVALGGSLAGIGSVNPTTIASQIKLPAPAAQPAQPAQVQTPQQQAASTMLAGTGGMQPPKSQTPVYRYNRKRTASTSSFSNPYG